MAEHVKDCRCLRCRIWSEGNQLIEAGELDPWAFPTALTEIVAEIVGQHPDIEERARRAEWFCNQLLGLVEHAVPKELPPSTDADILPFKAIRRR
ncbi:MAG TPA: hypothetical protein VGV37_12905 [Aliidongia sp.]|uniref:hypothetical protein n=1 Tax=Aliidongia sp. TaxID=1914230 RepID=UPI002DDD95AC|nr:hypothetical protein [Aliidongia sp.]HEV2675435.1 hypothetical protein [Aliidongia sp.]